MKGPYERLKYDLRRVWECPVCQHRERTSGTQTHLFCRCQEKVPGEARVCMKLVEDGIHRVTPAAGAPIEPATEKPT